MSPKKLKIFTKYRVAILFILGLFLFLLSTPIEAACPQACNYCESLDDCRWAQRGEGVERIGIIGAVEEIPWQGLLCESGWELGTLYCSDSLGKCRVEGFPMGDNGQSCTARDGCLSWFTCNNWAGYGVWDAYESQCVTCNGKKENRILGNGSNVYAGCGSEDGNAGDGKCESACGADPACDEVSDGGYCKSGKACSNDTCTGAELCTGCTCRVVKPTCLEACQDAGYDYGLCMSGSCEPFSNDICYYGCDLKTGTDCSLTCYCLYFDSDKPSCNPYSSGNTCYYSGSLSCTNYGWSCSYLQDTPKPSSYYVSGSTCYYGCSVTCGASGWSRSGCSASTKPSCNPYSSGNTCYYNGTTSCGPSGWSSCSYLQNTPKPSSYYVSGSTCYYGCSVTCGASGWLRSGCNSCNLGQCCNCVLNGCDPNNSNCLTYKICNPNCDCETLDNTPPTTEIKIIRTSTGEDVTAAGTWLKTDNYTIKFEDKDEPGGSGLKYCEYSIYACDSGGTNCTTAVVPFTTRNCNWSFQITAGTSPYHLEGVGRYRIYSGATDNTDNSGTDYKYLNFDFTPPGTRIE